MELKNCKGYLPNADLIRVVALLLVLTDHCIWYFIPDSITQVQRHLFFAGNATLFFMLSGALLLPLKYSAKSFLKRRFLKVGVPFLLWLFIYSTLNINQLQIGSDFTAIRHTTKQIIFVSPFPEGWFFYVLTGIYLIMPVISTFIENSSKRHLQYYLLLWLAALTLPYGKYFGISGFSPTDNILGTFYSYTGYAVSGYYLMKYPLWNEKRNTAIVILTLSIIAALLPAILESRCDIYGYSTATYELSISTVGWCVIVFSALQFSGKKKTLLADNPVIRTLARISFGAYLCQHLVICYLLLPAKMSGYINTTESFILGITVTLAMAWVLHIMTPRIWRKLINDVRTSHTQ